MDGMKRDPPPLSWPAQIDADWIELYGESSPKRAGEISNGGVFENSRLWISNEHEECSGDVFEAFWGVWKLGKVADEGLGGRKLLFMCFYWGGTAFLAEIYGNEQLFPIA